MFVSFRRRAAAEESATPRRVRAHVAVAKKTPPLFRHRMTRLEETCPHRRVTRYSRCCTLESSHRATRRNLSAKFLFYIDNIFGGSKDAGRGARADGIVRNFALNLGFNPFTFTREAEASSCPSLALLQSLPSGLFLPNSQTRSW